GVTLHRRDSLPAELLAGAQPALAGDQLISPIRSAYDDRLQQTCLLDRRHQFLERRWINCLPGLERVRLDVLNAKLDEAPFALRFITRGPSERLEPPAQATASCGGFRH